jgi:adenylate cyclase
MRIRYIYEDKESVFDRETTQIVIGRPRKGLTVDLDLTPDDSVSRPHARIWVRNGEAWIEDMSSLLGTRVGGAEIKGKGKQRLKADVAIHIGQTVLRLERLAVEITDPDSNLAPEIQSVELVARITQSMSVDISPLVTADVGATEAMRRLSLLYELPLKLGQETDLDRLLQTIVEELVAAVPGANRGALLVKESKSDNFLLKAHTPLGKPSVSLTLAKQAIDQRRAILWQGDGEEHLNSQKDIAAGMYAPLLWREETIGVACVDNSKSGSFFGSDDLHLMLAIANHAAMAIAMHRLREDLRTNAVLVGRLLTNFSPGVRETLLEKARRGRFHVGGEKSEVTILFSDIRGFTQLSAEMETEDMVEMLNQYFSALIDAIFRNDGTIDKFIGDAILAVFGSPVPDVQQHEKAVRAALDMQDAMIEVSKHRSARGDKTCTIGIGIHSGEVLHGFIGNSERMEFTVIGDAVNRASRYCSAASAGEILISPAIYERVWRAFQVQKITIQTKHEGDLSAYRLQGIVEPRRSQ